MPDFTPVQPDVNTNTHISSDFGRLLEPGLRKIFFETYAEVPEQYSRVFNVLSSNKAFEEDHTMGAFSDWELRTSEIDTVAYDKMSDGAQIFYRHKAFTKGFMIGRELYDDEQYRQINKFPKAMARSGRAFVEKNAAELFVHAFDGGDYAIYDGKPLICADHPLVDSDKVGCNIVTGALTADNLKKALRIMREQVDEAGNLIVTRPNLLVVPPALEYKAKEILHSTLLPDTDLNNTNSVKGSLDLFVYDYIGEAAGGNDDWWFVMDTSLAELNFFWRIKPEFKWDEDFDTFVAKYRGYMRFSYGVSDWRGIVGSEGHATAETFDLAVTAGAGTTVTVKDKDGNTVSTGSNALTEGELYKVAVTGEGATLTANGDSVEIPYTFTAQEDMTFVSAISA